MSNILTHMGWGNLVNALRAYPELHGVLTVRDTVKQIVFTTPAGEKITIPENSRLEMTCGQEHTLYGIGIETEPGSGSYGMTHGMTPHLSDMLNVDPTSPNSKLFCFHQDGTEEITHVAIADPEGYGGFQWAAHITPDPVAV